MRKWIITSLILGTMATGLVRPAPAQSSMPSGPSDETASVAQQPSTQEPPRQATVSLEALVQEALEQNPAIQAARRSVDAKRAMVLPAQTLPDPMITFQTMGELVPPILQAGDPSSARTVGIEQEIPFPGKLALRGKMASSEADAEWWNYEQVRREVIADLKMAYFDLSFIDKALEIVRKNKGLLQQFERIADARYRVGQGIQQDLLKAQVEISKLLDQETVLETRRTLAQARINSLLFRPPETPIGNPGPLAKSELPYALDQLQQLARANDPSLKMRERAIDRTQYGVQLARKEFYPDFSVGFTYFNRTQVPEMYGLMVKAKVPLFFWRKQRPELNGAAANLASAEKQRENEISLLSFKLKDAYLAATTADKLIQLYGTGVIPQATLSLESAVSSYQVGRVDFLTLIDNLMTLLDYEMKYYEVLSDYQKALAQLEPFVGVELTR